MDKREAPPCFQFPRPGFRAFGHPWSPLVARTSQGTIRTTVMTTTMTVMCCFSGHPDYLSGMFSLRMPSQFHHSEHRRLARPATQQTTVGLFLLNSFFSFLSQELLRLHVDPTYVNDKGKTAYRVAVTSGHQFLIEIFQKALITE